jgi:membrane protein DedA with SNARE-associated domain
MLDVLNGITEVLQGLLGSPWLWFVVFLVAALDALLPFMPSETTVIIVGVLVAPDPGRLVLLIVLATAGAWGGDWLAYRIGQHSGPAMLARLTRDERGLQRYEWTQAQIRRHGALLITAGRYIPGVRAATMFTSGVVGYPLRTFLITDLIGASIWASYASLAGYLGGATFHDRPALGMLMALGIGLALAVSIELGRRLMARRRPVLPGQGDAPETLHVPSQPSGAEAGTPRRRTPVRTDESPGAADHAGRATPR